MPQKPQRPFVPHRTPTTARPASTAAEFRLYRPFLPGSERETVEPDAFMDSGVVQGQSELRVQLQPIGDFLDISPVSALGYAQERSEDFYANEPEDEADELPPVEHFLDPLPPVQYFRADAEGTVADSGWVETDWQQYDWRAAAALGETSVDEASTAWATTDWDRAAHRPRDQRESAAHAIATALDEIARRIREGDLSPSGPGPMTDPATIAATLAALLGVRR